VEIWEEVEEHVDNLDFALVFCQASGENGLMMTGS
jgi:hypothetical protein